MATHSATKRCPSNERFPEFISKFAPKILAALDVMNACSSHIDQNGRGEFKQTFQNQKNAVPSPSAIVAQLSRDVVGQTDAKQTIAATLYCWKHHAFLSSATTAPRPNVLLLGPKSCGMTSLIRASANAVGLPYVEPDLTEYFATGLQGGPKSVNDMAALLLREIPGSVLPSGPIGLISLEGIEQLAITDRESASRKEAVQASIARMAEGKTLTMTFAGKLITFDSRRILFVASGNPNGIEKIILTRLGHGGLGFNTCSAPKAIVPSNGDALRHVTQDDLLQFGFTPSFLSAFETRACLNPLAEEDLVRICRHESPLLAPFKQAFAGLGVLLQISPQALKQIAKAAADLRTGARGIMTILHHVLDTIVFRLADGPGSVQKVVLHNLDTPPEIILGPSVIDRSQFISPHPVEEDISDEARRLFPNGLPRRPARPRAGISAVRLANKSDLARWLLQRPTIR